MAAPKVGGLRTMTVRDESLAGTESGPSVPVVSSKHLFQSQKSDLWLSLQERIIHWQRDGSAREELPKTASGNRTDMVRFKDFLLKTDDDEIADRIRKHPQFGVQFWDAREKQKELAQVRASEIRAAMAADPELAKALTLGPSDKKDWAVAAPAPEPSEDELEALTRPGK
jgi:hypothetical protein